MEEKQKLQRAKRIIDQLADGFDPVSGLAAPERDVINQVQVTRCLFYVSEVLRGLLERESPAAASQERTAFAYSSKPIPINEIVWRINALGPGFAGGKIEEDAVENWLMERQYLETITSPRGETSNYPTERGKKLGMSVMECMGRKGVYGVTVYNRSAQRFIINHLAEILVRQGRGV